MKPWSVHHLRHSRRIHFFVPFSDWFSNYVAKASWLFTFMKFGIWAPILGCLHFVLLSDGLWSQAKDEWKGGGELAFLWELINEGGGGVVQSSVAPMMDWTDNHYRTLARLISRRAWLYTEMIVADAINHQQENLVSESSTNVWLVVGSKLSSNVWKFDYTRSTQFILLFSSIWWMAVLHVGRTGCWNIQSFSIQ